MLIGRHGRVEIVHRTPSPISYLPPLTSATPSPYPIAPTARLEVPHHHSHRSSETPPPLPRATRSLRLLTSATLPSILIAPAYRITEAFVFHLAQISEQVVAIAAGRGSRDMAEDNVQLANLFQSNAAAIAGKHAVTTEQIEQAAAIGTFLMQHLRPKNAPPEKAGGPSAAIDARNRLATLLVHRYERLQAVAHYFAGDDWEDKVPPLMSRVVKREKQETGE